MSHRSQSGERINFPRGRAEYLPSVFTKAWSLLIPVLAVGLVLGYVLDRLLVYSMRVKQEEYIMIGLPVPDA
jgi:hypothetical protein